MIETSEQVEPVFPAATVVLVRDGDTGLETLLVQRRQSVKHMGGTWVFPGGKVDEADYPADRDEYRAALNAAIRETQEEAGLSLSADQLVYLSHWTTPEGAKKRFATWFFLVKSLIIAGSVRNWPALNPQTIARRFALCHRPLSVLRISPNLIHVRPRGQPWMHGRRSFTHRVWFLSRMASAFCMPATRAMKVKTLSKLAPGIAPIWWMGNWNISAGTGPGRGE